jgi:hypothetical protein
MSSMIELDLNTDIDSLSGEITSLFEVIDSSIGLSREVKELLEQNRLLSYTLLKYTLLHFRVKYLYSSNKIILDTFNTRISTKELTEYNEQYLSQIRLVSRLESLLNMSKQMLDKVKKMNETVSYQIEVIANENMLL